MADESREAETDTDPGAEQQKRRSLVAVVIAAIVIVVIVLVLLLLRGCNSSADNAGTTKNGPKTIESVQGLKPKPGAISIWVSDGTPIDTVLGAAGIRSGDVINMGGGRFVVTVPDGSEAAMAKRVSEIGGVIDVGLVYATATGK